MSRVRSKTKMDMLSVALLATDGTSVSDVARQLHFTEHKVYRLIRMAKDAGLIRETRGFRLVEDTKFSEEELARARQQLNEQANKLQSDLRNQIQARTSWTLQEVHVFEAGKPGRTVQSRVEYRQTFCKSTSQALRGLLEGARRIAVAWGRLIRAAVDEQRKLGPLLPAARAGLVVLPVRGDSAGKAQSTELSPGRIALDLSEALTGTTAACRCLPGIPPFLPRIDEVDDPQNPGGRRSIDARLAASVLREYVSGSASFADIFLGRKPLIDQVDTILTSVGTLDAFSIGPWTEQVLAAAVKTDTQKELLRQELERLAVGDIAGVMIPRVAHSEKLDAWKQTWIGLTEEHLRECVQRASESRRRSDRKPGVVILVVADDANDANNKAELLVQCMERKLASRCLIDRPTAAALTKKLR